MNSEAKTCQNCKNEFVIEPEDFNFYEKIKVPPPTWCWKCRAMRRMAFRNMRHMYVRNCDATGKKIYTLMPPGSPMPVYSDDYWRSDKWDPMDYGREYDFSRPFFEQIRELYNTVPWGTMWSMEKVNSDFSFTAYSKNCYLCFDSGYIEDSAYSVTLLYSKNCFDIINVKDCEFCYYCINTSQSYKTFFSRNCASCVEVWFSQDCVGCNNCFGCSGLRNKSYCIFNKQYDRETYKAKLTEMKLNTWSGIQSARKLAQDFWKKSPVKYFHGVKALRSSGDYLYNCTELINCFFAGNAQNMRHCQSVIFPPNKDSMDITSCEGTDLAYEILAGGHGVHKTLGCAECANVSDSAYAINCRFVSTVFGCVAVKSKSYCILNKQYSKEEYFELLPKIRNHMDEMPYVDVKGREYRYGDFFPFDMSPFGYSQTQAFEYFQLNEEEAKKQGLRWREKEKRDYTITKRANELPDDINSVDDKVMEGVIECAHSADSAHIAGCDIDCATAFRITKQELDFYRKFELPLPRLCFNCRHVDRVQWRNIPALYHRRCMCLSGQGSGYKNVATHFHGQDPCPNEFQTSYAPGRPEIVYCEKCYQAEVV
ncbi:MAG: Uncharacterized protein G01um101430_589 [Parcubacteria group bacterium Gr01-1014_30]|nr:MAG: Uncharacterized protein G01um101430_589 [Parcubacteria group bacterium Gr01-1014_30]